MLQFLRKKNTTKETTDIFCYVTIALSHLIAEDNFNSLLLLNVFMFAAYPSGHNIPSDIDTRSQPLSQHIRHYSDMNSSDNHCQYY